MVVARAMAPTERRPRLNFHEGWRSESGCGVRVVTRCSRRGGRRREGGQGYGVRNTFWDFYFSSTGWSGYTTLLLCLCTQSFRPVRHEIVRCAAPRDMK